MHKKLLQKRYLYTKEIIHRLCLWQYNLDTYFVLGIDFSFNLSYLHTDILCLYCFDLNFQRREGNVYWNVQLDVSCRLLDVNSSYKQVVKNLLFNHPLKLRVQFTSLLCFAHLLTIYRFSSILWLKFLQCFCHMNFALHSDNVDFSPLSIPLTSLFDH